MIQTLMTNAAAIKHYETSSSRCGIGALHHSISY